MKEIGAAVLGLGVGKEHARTYADTPGTRLRWVFDRDRERMTAAVAATGQGQLAQTWAQVLADAQTDVVSIATYDDQHASQVLDAFRAGKHVFCEKPLCNTREELEAIRRAQRESGKQLGCNLVLRAAPLYAWLRGAIRAGELGEIYAFDGDYLFGRIEKITQGWRSRTDDYSVTQGGGVHLVDLMLWLTGQKPVAVSAWGNRIATRDTPFRYDDFVAATFRFPSGLVGRITSNFGCVHRHQHVVRVFGTRATFLCDDSGPRIHRSRDPALTTTPLILATQPPSKGALIPAFVERVRAERAADDDAAHEFDVMAACIAVDQALRSGETVAI